RHVADELGLGHACCHLSSLKIEHLRRNMSTFCCTHWVYYISEGSMQAFSPDFMRLFLRLLWKTGINSGDNRLHTSSARRNSGRHRPAAGSGTAAVNQIHLPDQSAYRAQQSPGFPGPIAVTAIEIRAPAHSRPFCGTADQGRRSYTQPPG